MWLTTRGGRGGKIPMTAVMYGTAGTSVISGYILPLFKIAD